MTQALNWNSRRSTVISPVKEKADLICDDMNDFIRTMVAKRIFLYNLFWSDPVGIATEWGLTAAGRFSVDKAMVEFLYPLMVAAGTPEETIAEAIKGIPAGWIPDFSAGDGSVTLLAAEGYELFDSDGIVGVRLLEVM